LKWHVQDAGKTMKNADFGFSMMRDCIVGPGRKELESEMEINELYGEIKGYCRECGSIDLDYYFGTLGYEAIVCNDCGTHHTNAEPIIPKEGEK